MKKFWKSNSLDELESEDIGGAVAPDTFTKNSGADNAITSITEMKHSGGGSITLIDRGIIFEGKIRSQNTLHINGKIKGHISTTADVVIGETGKIEGDVAANDIVIMGTITGNLDIKSNTVLKSNSSLAGEVKTSKLTIEEGSFFSGKCSMTRK